MVKLKKYDLSDKVEGTIDVSNKIFGLDTNNKLVQFVLVNYDNIGRSGLSQVKNRSAVRGGGAKPFRQKGTGRARAGTNNSPLWRGGGVIFGPNNNKRSIKINRKVRQKALFSLLSDKKDKVVVLSSEDCFSQKIAKTKDFVDFLKSLGLVNKKVLYVSKLISDRELSIRNIKKISSSSVFGLNIRNILNSEFLIIESSALKQLEEIYAK